MAATPARLAGATAFDAVLLAASQGGLHACREVVSALPADFPAAVIYAQHRSPRPSSDLAELLARWTALEVRIAEDGGALEPGTLTIASAQESTRVGSDRRIALRPGLPGVHLADDLLTSAAEVYGRRLLAVVLTGRLHDGTAGVQAVKRRGGRVIVEDPETAEQGSMPAHAVATGCADLVLELPRIPAAVVALVSRRRV